MWKVMKNIEREQRTSRSKEEVTLGDGVAGNRN